MFKTISASVMPESVTGYHQRIEYDTKEGICHEYRVGCSWDSVGKHITEPMNDEKWTRLCAAFIEQFSKHKRNFPDYSVHLEIEEKEIV